LSAVAGAAAEAGDHDRGQLLLSQAENLARAITDPDWQAAALREVADAGEFDWAEDVARAITNPDRQAAALIMLAQLL
jgi:hypothetical protein